LNATDIAHAVRTGATTARAVTSATLDRIARDDPAIHAFTATTSDRALAEAAKIDAMVAAGHDPGPLAGVPFAVKNLFDIQGLTTLAGSKILATSPPATGDATAIARLNAAGAILVGALNMEEFAYGFFTDNAHHGRTLNPHDRSRTAGGSSGGSGAAVAAGLVPLTLGTDTNGSIRVPAAFCGIVGFKPTYGRLSRAGIVPFVPSFDHIGPLARTVADVALAYDAMQGTDPADPVQCGRPIEPAPPTLHDGIGTLRIAIADGYFAEGMTPAIAEAMAQAAAALSVSARVTIPEPAVARAAAYVITSTEGTHLQRDNLRTRPHDFDPATRDRFLAGAFIPADWYLRAQRFRTWFRDAMREIFRHIDVILAPAAPFEAPTFDAETIDIAGHITPIRPTIGRYTQPLSLIGLPILAIPIHRPGHLPTAIQLIGPAYSEAALLRVGQALQTRLA
jgi:AtzE family amidohydrolase